jgi:putative antitoxin of VapBC-like toxin-antitoxin system
MAIKRTSLNLKLDLLAEAREVLGTKGTTETIHRALAEIVTQDRLRRLAARTFDDLTPEVLAELRKPRTA